MTDRTRTAALSQRFVDDHRERVQLPGIEVSRNGRGVTLELTLGELHDLAHDAQHFADPDYGRDLISYDLGDLHRSAKKVVEQLKRDGLWTVAMSPEARAAYNVEASAVAEAQRAEADADREYLRNLLGK